MAKNRGKRRRFCAPPLFIRCHPRIVGAEWRKGEGFPRFWRLVKGCSLSLFPSSFLSRARSRGWKEEAVASFFPSFSPLPPFFRLFRILSKVRSADDKCARPAELCLFWEGRVCLNGRGAERWDLTKEEWPRAKRERHVPSTFLPLSKKLEQVGTSARVITSQHCCFYDRLRNSTDFT